MDENHNKEHISWDLNLLLLYAVGKFIHRTSNSKTTFTPDKILTTLCH